MKDFINEYVICSYFSDVLVDTQTAANTIKTEIQFCKKQIPVSTAGAPSERGNNYGQLLRSRSMREKNALSDNSTY